MNARIVTQEMTGQEWFAEEPEAVLSARGFAVEPLGSAFG
jgi:hypothetical protein